MSTRSVHWALLFAAILPGILGIDVLRRANRRVEEGNAAMSAGKARDALGLYDQAAKEGVQDPALDFNRGDALSVLGRHDEAVNAFLLATKARDPGFKAQAFFNLGNAFFRGEKFSEAVDAYTRSLMLQPRNESARWNLELALRKKREQDEKIQDKQNQDKSGENKQDQQQQSQDQQPQEKQAEGQQGQEPQTDDQSKQDQQPQDPQQDQQQNQQQPQDQQAAGDGQPQSPEPKDAQSKADQNGAEGQEQGAQPQPREGQKPPSGAPTAREIDAVLDSLERSPHELEKARALLRAVRRSPPVKDW